MATLTIRKIPDEQIQQLKEVAEKNNRSMESQVRSILEGLPSGMRHIPANNSATVMAVVAKLLVSWFLSQLATCSSGCFLMISLMTLVSRIIMADSYSKDTG